MARPNIGEYSKKKGYKHSNKWNKFIDKSIIYASVFGAIMDFTQAGKIWYFKEASGVSLISWAGYFVVASFWLNYGFIHKQKAVIIMGILTYVSNLFVIIGVLLYGRGFF